MISRIPITELTYFSLFSYVTGHYSTENSEILQNARAIAYAIKNENYIATRKMWASEFVAKKLHEVMRSDFLWMDAFSSDAILVPVPRSSLTKQHTLWPSSEIAKKMENEGFGKAVQMIKRIKPVRKSSMCLPHERAKPIEHYDSLGFDKIPININVDKIILIDDVVTRGHTFMGAAWKIFEKFPKSKICCFAAVRAISQHHNFKKWFDPVKGKIEYRKAEEDCLRNP
ncbi:MAG: phosphoribosyltransferase [Thermoplasmata archaeon]|nr:phosphoribosyltransferase [Thermoplasmata archaeon]